MKQNSRSWIQSDIEQALSQHPFLRGPHFGAITRVQTFGRHPPAAGSPPGLRSVAIGSTRARGVGEWRGGGPSAAAASTSPARSARGGAVTALSTRARVPLGGVARDRAARRGGGLARAAPRGLACQCSHQARRSPVPVERARPPPPHPLGIIRPHPPTVRHGPARTRERRICSLEMSLCEFHLVTRSLAKRTEKSGERGARRAA